jgi:deoxyribonuclease-4
MKIGCHLSSSKGFLAMGKTALKIDANVFQFFTRNPRGGKAKAVNEDDILSFLSFAESHGISDLLAHAPYTMNLCSPDNEIRCFSINMLEDDINRMEHLPGNMYNLHPGSHVNQEIDKGITMISAALNSVLFSKQSTIVLLETMAGKGSEIGGRFEDLHEILSHVNLSEKIGVCLDTCHIFDGGYDIVSDLDAVLNEFDKYIGLKHLKAIHLNDSKNPIGSKKDRHEAIGMGNIGLKAFKSIINHPSLKNLPFYLETPNDIDGYKKEIAILRGLSV